MKIPHIKHVSMRDEITAMGTSAEKVAAGLATHAERHLAAMRTKREALSVVNQLSKGRTIT